MRRLQEGQSVDGFLIGECLSSGAMAHIHRVTALDAQSDPGFPMVMKVPRLTTGDGTETIVSHEVELHMLQDLQGPHVPRFVAAGDLDVLPYIVMEKIDGRTLAALMSDVRETHKTSEGRAGAPLMTVARLGAAMARAAHSLHQQNAVHEDLKPANVMIKPDGEVVLLDFGLSYSGHFPDLLAEQLRQAVGSPAWISPEQVVGTRGDPRSDIFAIGVMLYEMLTGELPYGEPESPGGLRLRLWMDAKPPRQWRPEVPPWMQEVVLRCLEHHAADRYPSAAHLAFDLRHPTHVEVGERGHRMRGTGAWEHLKRWVRAAGREYEPSPLPARRVHEVPIVMAALPHGQATDATLYALHQTVDRALGSRPGAQLAVVTVVLPDETHPTEEERSEVNVHRHLLAALQRWTQGLDLRGHQVSCHVLEADDVAKALLEFAHGNHVSMIIMGAATHGLALQPWIPTVPIKVAMEAPCTVTLVKQAGGGSTDGWAA